MLTQRTRSTGSIESEFCGRSAIYGHLELIFFNCYCCHSYLVLRNRDGTANIVHSRDDVMQGDPLGTVPYGIIILPLIKCQKWTYLDVTQPWFADDDGALGTFDKLEQYFNSLKCNGLARGYYPNPTKIILDVHF